MKIDFDELNILRKISDKPKISQRKLANKLGFSLGKLNYCLRALKEKGLIKIHNFIIIIFFLPPLLLNLNFGLRLNFERRPRLLL